MRRVLPWLLGIALTGGFFVWFALSTQLGARIAVAQLHRFAVPISVTAVAGTVKGPLELSGVHIQTAAATLKIERLMIDLRPTHLLVKRLYIDSLVVDGVEVAIAAPAEPIASAESTSPDDGDLPIDLVVEAGLIRNASVVGLTALSIRDVTIRVAGGPRDFELVGQMDVQGHDVPGGTLALAGTLTPRALEVDSLEARVLDGLILGRGSLSWRPILEWRFAAEARDIAPAQLFPDPSLWPGKLGGRASTEGRRDSTGISGRVVLDTINGAIRDAPFTGRGSASLRGQHLALAELNVHWGVTKLRAAGEVADSLSLSFDLDAPDLADVWPGASGALSIDGRVGGTRSLPRVSASLAARDVRAGNASLDNLSGRVDLDLADPGSANLDLTARRVLIAGRPIERLQLFARGTRTVDEPSGVALNRLRADVLGGALEMRGWFTWEPGLQWRLAVRVDSLSPASLLPDPTEWPGRLSLRGSTQGKLTDGTIIGDIEIDTIFGALRNQPLGARASAELEADRYSVRALSLAWGRARLQADGPLGAQSDLQFELQVPDLAPILPGAEGTLRSAGRVRGSRARPEVAASLVASSIRYRDYELDDLEAQVRIGMAEDQIPEIELRAAGVSLKDWRADRLELSGHGLRSPQGLVGLAADSVFADPLDGELRASGRVTWKPKVDWRIDVRAARLDPTLLLSNPTDWEGRIGIRGSAQGMLLSGSPPTFTLSVDTLHGSLRGQPVQGRARAVLDEGHYRLDELDLRWGNARLHAHGRIGTDLEARIEAAIPNIESLVPDASGSLSLVGDLGGTPSSPMIKADVIASDLSFMRHRLGELKANADFDLGSDAPGRLDVDAADITIAGVRAERFRLTGRGTATSHRISASLARRDPDVELVLAGGLLEGAWRGEVRDLAVNSPSEGAWVLRSPTTLSGSPTAVRIGELCLDSRERSFCTQGSWARAAEWSFASSMQSLPLSLARVMLPPGWSLTGSLHGEISASATADGDLRGHLELYPRAGQIAYPLLADTQTVMFEDGSLVADIGPDGLQAHTRFTLTDSTTGRLGELAADLELPRYSSLRDRLREQAVSGRLEAVFDELTFLEAFSPLVTRTAGRLALDVSVDGTVAQPQILGESRLTEGRVDIPGLGIGLRDVRLTAAGDGTDRILFSGRAASGPGYITLEGEVPALPSAESPLRVTLQGERFQIANTAYVGMLVTPDIEVEMTGEQLQVSGEVVVPQAVIELGETPEYAVPPSRDVVFVGRQRLEPADPRTELSGRVRVILGDDVALSGKGFAAKLRGSLLAIDEPDKPTAGSGELEIVDGRYEAYGQNLTIERGRLLFAGGPIDNPGLDVRAVREVSDTVRVGLEIKGTLQSPEVTTFSEPPMTESEALSYLVLGRPLSQASESQAGTVSKAASSLSRFGGDYLAQRVTETLGLDEVKFESSGGLRDTSLLAAKYLSPRLYVTYGIGLFDYASTFRVRYVLSSKWTLAGETGRATSGEVRYRIERGN